MVWRGYDYDGQIYFSANTYDFSRRDGKYNDGWGTPKTIGSVASTNDAPSNTKVHNAVPWLGPQEMYRVVWRGRDNDRIYYSETGGWRGSGWSWPEELPVGGATSTAPSASGNMVVWRGLGGDSRLFYSYYTLGRDLWKCGTWQAQGLCVRRRWDRCRTRHRQ